MDLAQFPAPLIVHVIVAAMLYGGARSPAQFLAPL